MIMDVRGRIGTLLMVLLLSAGCVSRSAPPINYYSLLSVEQLGNYQPLASRPELRLGIGPITLVESLRRSQIVTRTENNVYTFDEYNKWAGPLEKDLAMTLGAALGYFTGAGSIDYFPWQSYFVPTHRIVIHIERLDGQLGAEAVLHARWNVLAPDGKEVIGGSTFKRSVDVMGEGYQELVRIESMLIAELGQEIARAVVQ